MKHTNQPHEDKSLDEILEEAFTKGDIVICTVGEYQTYASNVDVPHISLRHAQNVAIAMNQTVIKAKGLSGIGLFIHNGVTIVGVSYIYVDLNEVRLAEDIRKAIYEQAEFIYEWETQSGNTFLPFDQAA